MIGDAYREVQDRIAAAASRAHRNVDEITLIAVSKTNPVARIEEAMAAGVRVFGENRVQELREKVQALPDTALSWHLIGTLQTNKVKYLPQIPTLAMIHSVDSIKLAQEIERQMAKEDRVMDVLLEVNVAREETKAGVTTKETEAFLREAAALPHLSVKGLMTIAPFTEDAETSRPFFSALRELMEELNGREILPRPMTELSMGMTGDFEVAVEEGATLVRVGTAIFGARQYSDN